MRVLLAAVVLLGFTAESASACAFGTPKGPNPAPAAASEIPAVGTEITQKLKKEQMTPDVAAKVQDLVAKMTDLLAAKKVNEARAAEEDALHLLGYHKVYMRCGSGAPVWLKPAPRVTAPPPRSAPSI